MNNSISEVLYAFPSALMCINNEHKMLNSSHSGIGLMRRQTTAISPHPFLYKWQDYCTIFNLDKSCYHFFISSPTRRERESSCHIRKPCWMFLGLLFRPLVFCVKAFVLKIFWWLKQTKLDANDNPTVKNQTQNAGVQLLFLVLLILNFLPAKLNKFSSHHASCCIWVDY